MRCSDFRRNPDGSWTCIVQTKIAGYAAVIDVNQGTIFWKGQLVNGLSLVGWLEKNCLERTYSASGDLT